MRVTTSMFRNPYTRNTRTSGTYGNYTGITSALYTRGRNTSRRVSGLSNSGLRSSAGTGQIGQTLYKNTQKAASGLRGHTEKLLASGENSLFKKAEETGSTSAITSEVKEFAADYNQMVTNMKKTGGSMNNIYLTQLGSYVAAAQTELAAIGITANKDGTLAIDKKKLEAASAEDLQKVFDGSTSFAGKVSVKSIYAEANAVSSLASQSNPYYSGYNSYGGYSNDYSSAYSASYNSMLGSWLV
ncbi:MAG: hypothetical protein J6B10_09440 [Lachnospiraceae bacterium]|nr:hypothetical protein [Lachnospiraceae bacterium]